MSELPKHPTAELEGLRWEDHSEPGFAYWHLRDAEGDLIAEAYQRGDGIRWHCKTSDWREMVDDMETAKLRAVVSHVRHLYVAWADASVKARTSP